MYTFYKFHFLNGISEINQLFDDILIIWPAPVYVPLNWFHTPFTIPGETSRWLKWKSKFLRGMKMQKSIYIFPPNMRK